jgi:hypothetical protein
VFRFDDPAGYKLRSYQGTLVQPKPVADRQLLAARINERSSTEEVVANR